MTRAPSAGSTLVHLYAVAVLVLGTGAFFVVFGPGASGEPQPAVLGLWVIAYGVAAAGLLDGMLRTRRSLFVPPELSVFVGLAMASTFWSAAPALTARRSFGLLGTVLVGLLLAQRLRPLELLNALRQAMLIIALVSLGLYAAGLSAVLDETHGTLRGVVAGKNSLGFFMALGLVACALHYVLDAQRRAVQVRSAVPMIVALGLTDSKSAIIIAAAVGAGALIVLLRRRRSGRTALLAASCLLLATAALLLPSASLEVAADMLGEDTTLTGRDAVWEESLSAAEVHPLLGYGYGAFWEGTEAAARIQARLLWAVPTAHNGIIEVLLDLGAVGVLPALAVVGGLFVRGMSDARVRRKRTAALRLVLGALLVLSNLVESNFLVQNNVLTILVVAALAMRRQHDDDERDVRPPATSATARREHASTAAR